MAALMKRRKRASEENEAFGAKTYKIASLAADKKAREIKAYDVRGLTLVADSLLLCTVTSEPQMKAVFNAVYEGMKNIGVAPLRTEGAHGDGWVVMDYGIVIFHIFRERARSFYDLDGMWADAPELPLNLDQREESSNRS